MNIEAMKQALEALETFSNMLNNGYNVLPGGGAHETGNSAIVSLRAAIAEASMQRLTDVQQEMEPVAWMVTTEMQDGTRRTYPITGRYKDVCDACDFGDPIPLYTHPPRREWVGLTDDDMALCESDEDVRFVRAIEAKLKEKNS